jgi:hypothetical protein
MTMPSRFRSVVETQIRSAEARGAFDNLPGAGKPIPGLMDPDDPMWWIKGFVQREGVPGEAMLPPSLALRREVEKLPETVRTMRSGGAVRDHVEDLNHRIRRWIQIPVGPQVPLRTVDVDEVVAAWRAARAAPPPPAPEPARRRSGRWRGAR